jgi:uncharacterized membrane protein YjfL (UPF0719 family)
MKNILDPQHLVAAIVYSLLGLAVFTGGFFVFDRVTPYDLWHELIVKQNRALAQVLSGIAIALGLIVAASMLG